MLSNNAKGSSRLKFVISFAVSAGVVFLLWIFLSGPKLGRFYDFLLDKRPPPRIDPTLLIIDSTLPGKEYGDDILEPAVVSSLLYTMAELDAKSLIIQVPVLGLSTGGEAEEGEIVRRFDEEFSLLGRNIRNLFDAIKTGSVAPQDAERYVGALVELSENGKNRLVYALVQRDEDGIDSMERAAAFFGNVRQPGDIQVQLIRTQDLRNGSGEERRSGVPVETDEYSRAIADPDGIQRRVSPELTVFELSGEASGERKLNHITYAALKTYYNSLKVEYIDPSDIQSVLFRDAHVLSAAGEIGENHITIPLDKNGALIFEIPRNGGDFRRIDISDFLSYNEDDRALRLLLAEGEELGIFQGIEGENQPLILYDYALSLLEEFTGAPSAGGEEKKLAWRKARQNYFDSLENFLYGPAEMNLVGGFEEIIAFESWDSKPLGESEIAKMTEMRDAVIRAFVGLRAKYGGLIELRKKIESRVSGSFCILGKTSGYSPISPPASVRGGGQAGFSLFDFLTEPPPRRHFTDTEVSALLANSILTGRAVKPAKDFYLLLASLLSVFLVCFIIKSLRTIFCLGTGLLLTIISGAGFSVSFILSGIWLDPFIPAGAGAAGVCVSVLCSLLNRRRHSRRLRLAFGPYVSNPCLKNIIKSGAPLPSQVLTAAAAVVAVKNPEILAGADTKDTQTYTLSLLAFQKRAAELFKKAGGTIIGADGGTVVACFASPLERMFLRKKKIPSPYENNILASQAPALRAVEVISEIVLLPDCKPWLFGLDLGNCSFSWTALSGYFAAGIPVDRARVLARLAGHYQSRVVISVSVNDALPDYVSKKLGVLKDGNAAAGGSFYQLTLAG